MGKTVESGFTIIELIVVIVILGVLSATALPRFIEAQEDAHDANVLAAVGAFKTSVVLVKTQWYVNGNSNGDPENDVDGYGDGNIDVTGHGWPYAVNAVAGLHAEHGSVPGDGPAHPASNSECAALWMAIMKGSSAIAFTTFPLPMDADYAAATWAQGGRLVGCQYGYTADTNEQYADKFGLRWVSYNYYTGAVTTNVTNRQEEGN